VSSSGSPSEMPSTMTPLGWGRPATALERRDNGSRRFCRWLTDQLPAKSQCQLVEPDGVPASQRRSQGPGHVRPHEGNGLARHRPAWLHAYSLNELGARRRWINQPADCIADIVAILRQRVQRVDECGAMAVSTRSSGSDGIQRGQPSLQQH
jgi:hypothetical protein